MAKMFTNHPNLIGGYAPIQMECDARDGLSRSSCSIWFLRQLEARGPRVTRRRPLI